LQYLLRPIRPGDDPAVARNIRSVMTELGCTAQGFAIHDPEVDTMSRAHAVAGSAYWVVELDGAVVGGAGFARLAGTGEADALCELQKMYFQPSARGIGAGRALLELLLGEMRRFGYRRCYLETTSWMTDAQSLYRAAGFREIDHAMGATGHHSCDRFFLRELGTD
jgi:putative acetyltransferase